MKLTDAEWSVMEVLWSGERFSLGEVTEALRPVNGWSRNTVSTYLLRMQKKGLVRVQREYRQPYSAAVTREACEKNEREELLQKVYGGAVENLVAAFLKETTITHEEKERLKKLLDDMEV